MRNKFKFLIFSLIFFSFANIAGIALALNEITATSGNKTAEIYWNQSEGSNTYYIYRSTQPNNGFTNIATTSNHVYTDTTVSNGTKYYYYIKTFTNNQFGQQSQTVNVTPKATGTLAYIRQSDAVFQSLWIAQTNGLTSDTLSESEIYTNELSKDDFVDFLTSDVKQLIDFSLSSTPKLSHDMKWLFFIEDKSIRKINLETNEIKIVVSTNVEQETGFSISKDDQKIAYVKKRNNKYSLYLNTTQGDNEELLLSNQYDNKYPDFSPDNQKITYTSTQPSGENVYTINITTKTTSKLTNTFYGKRYPRFSPDGTKIAYQGNDSTSSSYDIFTISSTTTNQTAPLNITANSTTNEYYPAWSADNSKIAYILRNDLTVNNNPQYALHIMIRNADGSGSAGYLSKSANKLFRLGLTWQAKVDSMPPRQIIDLESSVSDTKSITATFTSAGDDGSNGQSQKYIAYYSQSPFTNNDLSDQSNNITKIELTSAPQTSGNTEYININHLKSNTTYYIGLTAVDEESNASALSNVITASTDQSDDTQPPDPPSSLTATAIDKLKIVLKWTHSSSTDTAGYNIYRDGTKIAQTNYQTQYTDTAITQVSQTCQYTIKAIDSAQNESLASNTVSATSKDTTIPLSPQWVITNNLIDKVQIKWQPVYIDDLAEYNVYREYNNEAELIATIDPAQTHYDDLTGYYLTKYTYFITTKDTASNESQTYPSATGTKGLPDNKRTLVIVNTNNTDSETIAQYYKQARDIPEENIIRLAINNTTNIYIDLYVSQIHTPIKNYILNNNLSDKILYLVTTKGVPVGVTTSTGDIRSVDTMLAKIYESPSNTNIPSIETIFVSPHNYFMGKQRFSPDYTMLLTSRLDGPTVELVKSMIDKAVYTQNYPNILKSGDMWIDTRNITGDFYDTYYAFADRFIGTAIIPAKFKNINYHLDTNSAMFASNTCYNTQYYYGWYSYNDFKEIFNGYLTPGSIAGHLDSASFLSTSNTGSNNWGIHLISRGATIAYGAISEPYSIAFPCSGIMYDRLYKGYNAAESYWCATNAAQWRMILVGDPLYKPFFEEPANDTDQITSSQPQIKPDGFRQVKATWETNKITQHAVQYFTASQEVLETGYSGWFSKNATVFLPYIDKNKTYYYKIKSKDLYGNEQISTTYTFEYTDADNDELEDNWETEYFGDTIQYNESDDPDCDGIINLSEYENGFNPLSQNLLSFAYISNTTKTTLSWDTRTDRIYKIYFTDSMLPDTPITFSQAGPYRIGAGQKISWIDDGVNTKKSSDDQTLTNRFYKITSTPVSK